MNTKKSIGNVGVLDLRKATDESINEIASIGNVGTAIYSRETAHLLTRLNIGNLGGSAQADGDFKMITGKTTFDKSNMTGCEKSNLIVTGKIIVSSTLSPDDIRENFGNLMITGKVICPKSLQGAIQEKIVDLKGMISTYPDNTILYDKNLVINNMFLSGLDSKSRISVLGNIRINKDVDNNILEEKLEYIYCDRKIIAHEQQSEVLNSMIDKECLSRFELIPNLFEFINDEFKLDQATLESWDTPKNLYITGKFEVSKDIEKDLFDKKVLSLILKEEVICKNSLRATISNKCDDININFITYEIDYLLNDGDFELTPSYLKYSPDKMVIINNGDIKINKEVDADDLFNKIEKIYNMGDIEGYGDQVGALQVKVVKNDGDFTDLLSKQESDEDENSIGNIGYFSL